MTANDPALMTTAYERVCDSYQAFDDFRTKLLGLLPTATGTGVFMLLSGKSDLLDLHNAEAFSAQLAPLVFCSHLACLPTSCTASRSAIVWLKRGSDWN